MKRAYFACFSISGSTTDLNWRFKNLHHIPPDMGLQMGVFGFFPAIKIIVICQVSICHLHLLLSVQINMCEVLHGSQSLWMHFHCLFSLCEVGKNLNTLNWSSMADNTITWGSIGGPKSPV